MQLTCTQGQVAVSNGFTKNFVALVGAVACLATTLSSASAQAQPEAAASTSTEAEATSATTLERKPKRKIGLIKAGWNLGLVGESFANEKEQAQLTGFGIGAQLRYGLLSTLELRAAGRMTLQSGYAQSQFGDNVSSSGVRMSEAVLSLKPSPSVAIEAGAIDQAHLLTALVVDSQPFPGVVEKISFGGKRLNLEVKAQQAIPTSTTLSTKAVESENTPTFLTETLTLKSELSERTQVMGYVTHYAYSGLPSKVAEDSELHGNTVSEITQTRYRFTHDFDGFILGGAAKLAINQKTDWLVAGYMVQNQKAPATYNQAQHALTSVKFALPDDVDLSIGGDAFFAESDVAPAFYNNAALGHNNRAGWAARVKAIFKEAGFEIGGRFIRSDVINPSLLQSRQDYILLEFETLYDFL